MEKNKCNFKKYIYFIYFIIFMYTIIFLAQNYNMNTLTNYIDNQEDYLLKKYQENYNLTLELESLKLEFINYKINNSKIELELYNKFLEKGYLTREDLQYEK